MGVVLTSGMIRCDPEHKMPNLDYIHLEDISVLRKYLFDDSLPHSVEITSHLTVDLDHLDRREELLKEMAITGSEYPK